MDSNDTVCVCAQAVSADGNNALACAVSLNAPTGVMKSMIHDTACPRMMGVLVGNAASFSVESFGSLETAGVSGMSSLDAVATGKQIGSSSCTTGISALLASVGQPDVLRIFLELDKETQLREGQNTLARTRDGYTIMHLLVIKPCSEAVSLEAACESTVNIPSDEDLDSNARALFEHWRCQAEAHGIGDDQLNSDQPLDCTPIEHATRLLERVSTDAVSQSCRASHSCFANA